METPLPFESAPYDSHWTQQVHSQLNSLVFTVKPKTSGTVDQTQVISLTIHQLLDCFV